MADYYRKTVNNTANDVKLKTQIGALTVKITENTNKINDLLEVDKDIKKDVSNNSNALKDFYTKQDILNITSQYYLKKYLYDKTYIDTNFLVKSEIDKKDNEILNKVNNHIQEVKNNYHLKNNVYDKKYIDTKIGNIYDKNLYKFTCK